jgi:hypothetical protein
MTLRRAKGAAKWLAIIRAVKALRSTTLDWPTH